MQPVVQRGEAEFISTHICLHFHKISLQVYDKSMITMSAFRDEKLMVNDRTIWIFLNLRSHECITKSIVKIISCKKFFLLTLTFKNKYFYWKGRHLN